MTILHITNCLSEGGVETLLYFFSKYLIARGHSVSILVLKRNEISLKSKFENAGIDVIVGKYKSSYNVLNVFTIKKYLRKYDIVHIHLFPVQFYVGIANYLLGCNKRVLITTEHNTWNNRRQHDFYRYIDRWLYRQYDYIVGISNDTSIALKEWLNDENISNNITTINNGVELATQSIKNINIAEFNCIESDIILTMIARFNIQKDQETLIRALTYLPSNVHVIFVGSGETLEYNQNLTRSLGLESRIYFAGFRDDIPSILKISHIGILCSNWEGFGLSVVEYMLAGLPVVASNIPGVGNIVGWDELLYTPKDPVELANKILRIITDCSFYVKAQKYCIERAKDFSMEKMTTQYLSIYNRIRNVKLDTNG